MSIIKNTTNYIRKTTAPQTIKRVNGIYSALDNQYKTNLLKAVDSNPDILKGEDDYYSKIISGNL